MDQYDTATGEAVGRVLDHYLHTAHAAALLLNPSREPLTLHLPRSGVTPEHLADHLQAMAWFEAEHHIITSAVTLAAQRGLDAYGWQLPWTMANFLDWRGHWHEWAAAQRAALAAATRLGDTAGQAAVHRLLAHSCAKFADYDEAGAHLTECLRLYQQLGDRVGLAHVHQTLSWVSAQQGRNTNALGHAEQALVLFQATGNQAGQAGALNNVGCVRILLGDYQQAQTSCQQALSLYGKLGDRPGEASSWDSLGYAEHQLGNFTDAADCYGHALSIFRELGNRYYQADTLAHLGDTHHAADEENKAEDAWRQAFGILDELQHPDAVSFASSCGRESAVAASLVGDPRRARTSPRARIITLRAAGQTIDKITQGTDHLSPWFHGLGNRVVWQENRGVPRHRHRRAAVPRKRPGRHGAASGEHPGLYDRRAECPAGDRRNCRGHRAAEEAAGHASVGPGEQRKVG